MCVCLYVGVYNVSFPMNGASYDPRYRAFPVSNISLTPLTVTPPISYKALLNVPLG